MYKVAAALGAERSVRTVPGGDLVSMKEIMDSIFPYLTEVEMKLESVSRESEGILRNSSEYVLSGGGKRLRSALVIFCASINPDSLSDRERRRGIIDVAAAIELIHAATLVHDDIIDHATTRRLKPALNVKFGEEIAILLGDFLYARALGMITHVGDQKVASWIAETTQHMCEGEIHQVKYRYCDGLTIDDYLSFIEKKTGSLIAVSARCGAHMAGLKPQEVERLNAFALNIGIAYQMVDDLLDITGSEKKLGKTLRTDFYNGRTTLPVLLLFKEISQEERKKFPRNFYGSEDWDYFISLVEKYEVAAQIEEYANRHYRLAAESLQMFGPKVREPLLNLSRFVLNCKS